MTSCRILAAALLLAFPLRGRTGEAESPFDAFDPAFLKKAGVQALLDQGKPKEALHALAQHFRARREPRYTPGSEKRPAKQPGNTAAADGILKHRFVVRYGEAPRQFPDPMVWRDPALDGLELSVLNRHPWVDTLSGAWWTSGEARYVEGCMRLLRSWREANPPPPEGAPYTSPEFPGYAGIDAGMRVLPWIEAFYRMRDCPALTDEDMAFLLSLLEENAHRLADLSRADPRNPSNHFTVTYRGLFYIGLLFPEFKEAAAWREQGMRCLEDQLKGAVLADGLQWECSLGYHCNCIMDFTSVQRLAALNHAPVSAAFDRTIESMYDCLMKLSRPDRTVPLLNDTGGGSVQNVLSLGACLYKRADLKSVSDGTCWPSSTRIGGITDEERKAFEALRPKVPDVLSVALEPSGHYVMRSGWDPQDKYLLFDAGKYAGPHGHCDQLAIDVYAYGRAILVDPGTCHYADPKYGFLKSSASHNVAVGDEGGAAEKAAATVSLWMSTPRADAVSGEVPLPGGPMWRRTVVFVKPDFWIVADAVTPPDEAPHSAAQLWHFVPGEAKADKDRILFTYPPAPGVDGNLLLQWPAGKEFGVDRFPGFLGAAAAGTAKPDRNGKAAAEFVAVGQEGPGPLTFETLLYPYCGAKPPEAEITSEQAPGGTGIRIRQKDREDLLLLGNGKEPLKVWGYAFDGTLALLRLAGGKLERVLLQGGTRFQAPGGLEAASEKPFDGACLTARGGELEAAP